MVRLWRGKVQATGPNREVAAGRDHINVVGDQWASVARFGHRHRGMLGQQLDHQALVVGVEMLDDDEGHPTEGGQRVEQPRGGLQPACRRADRDDGQGRRLCGWRTYH